MTTPLTRGWLPVEVQFDERPMVVPECTVRWMEFGSTALAAPFQGGDVAKLRLASPPAREAGTDLDTLLRVASRLPAVTPAGFIFHISRCGSTLVANAFRTAEGTVVSSESQPISHLLRLHGYPAGRYLRQRWERTSRALLEAVFTLHAHYRSGEPERLVVKAPSFSILCLHLVRSWWPEVPCLVVVRDPVEVMMANLPRAGWMTFKDTPEKVRDILGWEETPEAIAEMADAEFAARVVARFLEAALAGVDDRCMIVDYEDLNVKRLLEIGEFFGIELKDGERLQGVLNTYSKDPEGKKKFLDDREMKRRLATRAVKDAGQRWAMPRYCELRAR